MYKFIFLFVVLITLLLSGCNKTPSEKVGNTKLIPLNSYPIKPVKYN